LEREDEINSDWMRINLDENWKEDKDEARWEGFVKGEELLMNKDVEIAKNMEVCLKENPILHLIFRF